jgi:hypothetical protein
MLSILPWRRALQLHCRHPFLDKKNNHPRVGQYLNEREICCVCKRKSPWHCENNCPVKWADPSYEIPCGPPEIVVYKRELRQIIRQLRKQPRKP